VDRNVVTATILIALIMVVWLTWLTPPLVPQDIAGADSSEVFQEDPVEAVEPAAIPFGSEALRTTSELAADSTILGVTDGVERSIRIQTDLYTALMSTKGGTITSFLLKEYHNSVDSSLVQLVDTSLSGALSLVFTTPSNRVYDTRSFMFEADLRSSEVVVGDQGTVLRMSTPVGTGSITKVYTFKNDSYEVGLDLVMTGSESFLTPGGYEVIWNGAIPFTEKDHANETQATGAFARSGGVVESAVLKSETYAENTIRGDVDWVAVKTKYFVSVIMPNEPGRAAELIGERFGETDDDLVRLSYSASLAMRAPTDSDAFRLYLGPMQLSRLRVYDADLYDMVDFGFSLFAKVTRPLAKYFFAPVFNFLAGLLPNYGLVIIIFSILVKLLVYPLTKSSFTSMAKMKELQPRMEAIKAQFPDAPQKQQEAMMKMYKETGVNPLGGCLPMLLQYPIIIALWQFLPQAIEIRQQGFLWAADLSAPDVLFNLPFDIPMYGNFVSGFTVLMGVSMIAQMRLQATPGTGAQAKIFTYVFPVMIFVIFNKLAAGLNLYYLCYNVLSAAQQKMINYNLQKHPELMKKKVVAKVGGKGSPGKKASSAKKRSKR
jgi:YidC/Oxa1 family membrane protein insertase